LFSPLVMWLVREGGFESEIFLPLGSYYQTGTGKMAKMEKETRLKLAICLSLVFMCIEIAGGYLANSIAIFSDAAHLLTDIAGFAIALIATIAAKAPGTKTLTFGMARAEVFGAFGSVLSLWIITAVLLYAAFFRGLAWFQGTAEETDGFLMFVVACFGVVVNLCLGYVFHEDHGGAFHPAHSHDHGHACGGSGHHGHEEKRDPSSPVSKKHSGHAHDHGHGECGSSKQKESGHDHGHAHGHNEKTPLLGDKKACGGGHSHDHTSHKESTDVDTGCSGHGHSHDHASHSHSSHDHDEEAAHGHDHSHGHGHGHEHAHGKYGSAELSEADDHYHHDNHTSDVNLEAAYLHVLTDLIQSIGVAIAGAVLWWKPHWQIIDPICTVLFSIVALNSTLPLIGKIGLILFEGAPANVRNPPLHTISHYMYFTKASPLLQIDWEIVMTKFQAIDGVEDVHDLHIWSISSNSISLTCHIRVRNFVSLSFFFTSVVIFEPFSTSCASFS